MALVTVALVTFFFWPKTGIQDLPKNMDLPNKPEQSGPAVLSTSSPLEDQSISASPNLVDQTLLARQKKRLLIVAAMIISLIIILISVALILFCCCRDNEEPTVPVIPEVEPEVLVEEDEPYAYWWIPRGVVAIVVVVIFFIIIAVRYSPKIRTWKPVPGSRGANACGEFSVAVMTPKGYAEYFDTPEGVTRANILAAYLHDYKVPNPENYTIIEGWVKGKKIFPLRKVFSIVDTTDEGLTLAFAPEGYDTGVGNIVKDYLSDQAKLNGDRLEYADADEEFRKTYNQFVVENYEKFGGLRIPGWNTRLDDQSSNLISYFVNNALYSKDMVASRTRVSFPNTVLEEKVDDTFGVCIEDFAGNPVELNIRTKELQEMIEQFKNFIGKN